MLYLLLAVLMADGRGGGCITLSPLGLEIARLYKEGCSEDGVVEAS